MRDQVVDLVDAFELVTVGAAAELLSEWEPGAHQFSPLADDPQTCVHCGGWPEYHEAGGST